ncbi:MAG: GGDEF domain-containing protein [Nanobdellota archaeon]
MSQTIKQNSLEDRLEKDDDFLSIPKGVSEDKFMRFYETLTPDQRADFDAIYSAMRMENVTDGLTGLYNRSTFDSDLSKEIQRVKRSYEKDAGQDVSLLMTDIDYFKKINDTYGHQFGDWVLKEVSDAINLSTREVDSIYRYGGEEIAVIAPQTTLKEGYQLAERIRDSVPKKVKSSAKEKRNELVREVSNRYKSGHDYSNELNNLKNFNRFLIDGKQEPVTLSAGLSNYIGNCASKEEMLCKADKALYNAKENGRNRVEVIGDALPLETKEFFYQMPEARGAIELAYK